MLAVENSARLHVTSCSSLAPTSGVSSTYSAVCTPLLQL